MTATRITTDSPEATFQWGVELGGRLMGGETILLAGPLGAGKTTLAQGICRGLGLPESTPVRSPSFALVNEYKGARTPIRHADLYRLDDPAEMEELGLFDEADETVVIIEWADRLAPPLGGVRIAISIDLGQGDERYLTVEKS